MQDPLSMLVLLHFREEEERAARQQAAHEARVAATEAARHAQREAGVQAMLQELHQQVKPRVPQQGWCLTSSQQPDVGDRALSSVVLGGEVLEQACQCFRPCPGTL